MSVLIVAEHDNKQLKTETMKLVSAAVSLGDEIHLLVAGLDCSMVAKRASEIQGVTKVLIADNPVYQHQLAENLANLIVELSSNYKHILAATSSTGKNVMPRVAALIDVAQISDVIRIESSDTFVRPIYAGNAIATVQSNDSVKILTIRTSAFEGAQQSNSVEVESISSIHANSLSRFVADEISVSERPDLGTAAVVISGGRGMQNGENFTLLEGIADKLGAAIGASRAAVDAGFVPNDMQVGQTGKVVAPDLYIAVGISGAIQHLAGMKDSKFIVAINKDPEAPIFQIADYGLVGDLFEVLPELQAKI
ncbi:FAD-binding protein [Alteromonas sp. M12]|uniref:electron transfer flavoprotein subunit alpha/FixB family protein n=1 Tax=Alteromonas sp. M12 TaxID=3135644 RepID=UPI00319D94BD